MRPSSFAIKSRFHEHRNNAARAHPLTLAFIAFLNDLGSSILTFELEGNMAANASEGVKARAKSCNDNFMVIRVGNGYTGA